MHVNKPITMQNALIFQGHLASHHPVKISHIVSGVFVLTKTY